MGRCLPALLLLGACAPAITQLEIEPLSDGFQWAWNPAVEGMEGSLTFVVRDQLGRPVTGLAGHHFLFSQDGQASDVESVSSGTDLRMSPSLVLDSSKSIREAGAERDVLTAAVSFVGALHERATFRYYSFSTEATELNSLSQVAFDGQFTSMYDAVLLAARNAVARGEERVVVVFTDGRDNRSAVPLDEVVTYLEVNRVVVHTIGMGDVDTSALSRLSSAAGGLSVVARTPAQLGKVFDRVGEQLGGVYRVRYVSPSRPGPDAHDLRLEVRRKTASDDVQSTFMVARGGPSGARCVLGETPAAHSDILCCAEGERQSAGSFTCGRCAPVDGIESRLVPGTNTCCTVTGGDRDCAKIAVLHILEGQYPQGATEVPLDERTHDFEACVTSAGDLFTGLDAAWTDRVCGCLTYSHGWGTRAVSEDAITQCLAEAPEGAAAKLVSPPNPATEPPPPTESDSISLDYAGAGGIGRVTFSAAPPAQVYIDGVLVGTTPLEVPVAQGSHVVRVVSKDGSHEIEDDLEIQPGSKVVREYTGQWWLDDPTGDDPPDESAPQRSPE